MVPPTDRAKSDVETLPVEVPGAARPRAAAECLALAVAWSIHEPWRAGECAYLPPTPDAWRLGRGAHSNAPDARLVSFLRRRGADLDDAGPLLDPHLSREQLRIFPQDAESLRIENVGRAELRIQGVSIKAGVARPGDLIEIDRRLLLVVSRCSPPVASARDAGGFAFGEADDDGLVGESDAIWRLRARIRAVAAGGGHVLILGASGAGKELVARAVHRHSERGTRQLIARNAATLPDTLVDAELFGNARNFPNPGMPERPGLIGAADGSSLFIDEIGDLTALVQPHLLRVLDHGEYHRLGESTARRADLRLVAATNRPRATLRADLAARFVNEIGVPDLNARREDLPLLARHLLRRYAQRGSSPAGRFLMEGPHGVEPRVSIGFVEALMSTRWSTNVRELDALLRRAIDENPGATLERVVRVAAPESREPGGASPEGEAVGESEAERIQAQLDRHNGSIEKTWRALGLPSRHALRRLIDKHGLVVRRAGRHERAPKARP
jgi:DNA-binding NtrC family response regulator